MTTALTTRTSAPVGEILRPDPAFDGRAIPGTYGAITRHPLRVVSMMPIFEMESRGYQIHQQQCLHRHRCYYYRQWTCADCGERL